MPASRTSCGARATRRATTSSTATRAWATRSRAASGFELAGARPRGVRARRRRLVALDDRPPSRDRRAGGGRADRRPGPGPRLRVDRRAVGAGRSAALRHRYRYRDPGTGGLDGELLPVDLAADARSLGPTSSRRPGSRSRRPRYVAPAPRRGRPSCTWRPIRWPVRRTPRRGGRAGRRGLGLELSTCAAWTGYEREQARAADLPGVDWTTRRGRHDRTAEGRGRAGARARPPRCCRLRRR